MIETLRIVAVISNLLTLISNLMTWKDAMSEELLAIKASLADQSAKIDLLIAAKANPADAALVSEIKATVDAQSAKIDVALAPT